MQADILRWRDWLFAWLLRSTIAVTAGLVLEGAELFHDISWLVRHWWFRRRFHFSLPEQHAPEWAKVLAFVGWILITGGVAGEWYTEAHIEEADATIQSFMNARFEDAEVKSSALNLRASVNELDAAQLSKNAADLRRQNIANEQALVELKAKYAWRTISPAQAKILCDQLQTVRGRTVAVGRTISDPEQDTFGSQRVDVLNNKKCGLSAAPISFGMFLGGSGHALDPIALEYAPANGDLANAVAKALVAASLAKAPVPTSPPSGVRIGGQSCR